MKNQLKRILTKLLNPLVYKLGYRKDYQGTLINRGEYEKYSKENLLHNLWSIISETSFAPKHIIDIGANRGNWTREALNFFPNASFTMLEPQANLKSSFADILESNPNVRYYNYGAGSKAGTFKFTIANRDDSSTFRLSEMEAKERGLNQIDVPVVTMDSLISNEGLPIPDIVKIDAEGLDIEVLDGCNTFFGKTEIFLVEAAVVNNQFSNDLRKVLNFMETKGYKLFDFTDLNRPFTPSVLWLVEAVFIKRNGILDSQKWF